MDIPVNLYEPTELDRVCEQLSSAMAKCPELTPLLKRSVFDDKFAMRAGLVDFRGKKIDGALYVQVVISERLREIANAATRLAEWVPGSPEGLQKSEALRLVTDLTAPTADASAASRIARALASSQRYA